MTELPDKIAIDANGFGWRVWDDWEYWSMVPTNPDNSPIPQPLTWYVREQADLPQPGEPTMNLLQPELLSLVEGIRACFHRLFHTED